MVGYHSGFTYNGDNSVFIGRGAGWHLESGNSNVAIGRDALHTNQSVTASASYNICIGAKSGYDIKDSNNNVCVGESTGRELTFGDGNTCLGHQAGYNLTYGDKNICIGNGAGAGGGGNVLTTGSQNIFVGYKAKGHANNSTNSIVIGHEAVGTGSNEIIIGNDSATSIQFGNFFKIYRRTDGSQRGVLLQANNNANLTDAFSAEGGYLWSLEQGSNSVIRHFKGFTSSGDNLSDDRLKFNEQNITNGLDICNQLSPERYDKSEVLNVATNTVVETGFIAQEVYEIEELRHAVTKPAPENEATVSWRLNYRYIWPYAISAIQQLSQTVTQLQQKVTELEARLDSQ